MSEPTAQRLAAALEEAGLPHLAQRARRFDYDDYRSEVTPFPQALLVQHLRAAGGPAELIQRVMDGEFDATEAEGRAWAASPEGRESFASVQDTLQRPRKGAFGQDLP